MASSAQLAVILKDGEGNNNDAIMHYTVYSAADRTRRAIFALVGCWVIAACSVPIPIAHFVLVPSFLIAGPVLAFLRLKMGESKENVVGICPRHNGEVTIKLENTDEIPRYTYCPECSGSLKIVKKED